MRPLPPSACVASISWLQHGRRGRRFLDDPATARRWFRGLLWRAFPEAQTDLELARLAAVALEVSEGRVRGWLRLDHDAKLLEVLKVLALAGVELVLRPEGEP